MMKYTCRLKAILKRMPLIGKLKEVYTQTHDYQNGENQRLRENLENIKKKWNSVSREIMIQMSVDFSSKTMGTRR